MKRKKYSPEYKRQAIELVRRSGASCRLVTLRVVYLRTCSHAGFESHSLSQKRPFPEQVAGEVRSWPASSVCCRG